MGARNRLFWPGIIVLGSLFLLAFTTLVAVVSIGIALNSGVCG